MSACASVIPYITHDEDSSRQVALDSCNATFEKLSVQDRVGWSLENLPGQHVVSSSFGAHAAVSLHLLTQQQADIPVILIDTGYLFPETYRFVDELTEKLQLNLQVYQSALSPHWQLAAVLPINWPKLLRASGAGRLPHDLHRGCDAAAGRRRR